MIKFLIKRLITEKELALGKRLTLEEISSKTNIHRTTLSRIANNKYDNTTTEMLDTLCTYFDVPIEGLIEHVKDEKR